MQRNNVKRLAVVLGARPNFIKAASFFAGAKKYPAFSLLEIHTGQHYDKNMSSVFFQEFGLPVPDFFLKNSDSVLNLGKLVGDIKKIFLNNKIDATVLFGDVHSTLAGALAAQSAQIPIIHVEAGLRSGDLHMPEEINRIAVDHMADYLFFSEISAHKNLNDEGISNDKIFFAGNIMVETMIRFKSSIEKSKILTQKNLLEKDYFVATLHRRENLSSVDKLKSILTLLSELSTYKTVLMPLHPGTEKVIRDYGLFHLLDNISCIVPLGYFDFVKLVECSSGVVTDSGGVQEETTYLNVPCCTLRNSTERPVTVEFGTNRLFGDETFNVEPLVSHLSSVRNHTSNLLFWDEKVSERIFDILEQQM